MISDTKFINPVLIDTAVEQRFKLIKKGQVQSIARGLTDALSKLLMYY